MQGKPHKQTQKNATNIKNWTSSTKWWKNNKSNNYKTKHILGYKIRKTCAVETKKNNGEVARQGRRESKNTSGRDVGSGARTKNTAEEALQIVALVIKMKI